MFLAATRNTAAMLATISVLVSCSSNEPEPGDRNPGTGGGSAVSPGGTGGQSGGSGSGSGAAGDGGRGGGGHGGAGAIPAWLEGADWVPVDELQAPGYCEGFTTTRPVLPSGLEWHSCGTGCSWTVPLPALGEHSFYPTLAAGEHGALLGVQDGMWVDDTFYDVRRLIELRSEQTVAMLQLRGPRHETMLCGTDAPQAAPRRSGVVTGEIPGLTNQLLPAVFDRAAWSWLTPAFDFTPFLLCETVDWTDHDNVRLAAACPFSLLVTSAGSTDFTTTVQGEILGISGGPWGLAWSEPVDGNRSVLTISNESGFKRLAEVDGSACSLERSSSVLGGTSAPYAGGDRCRRTLPGHRFFWVATADPEAAPVVRWSATLPEPLYSGRVATGDRFLAGLFGTAEGATLAYVVRLADGALLRLSPEPNARLFDAAIDGDTLHLLEGSTNVSETWMLKRLLRFDLTQWDALQQDGTADP